MIRPVFFVLVLMLLTQSHSFAATFTIDAESLALWAQEEIEDQYQADQSGMLQRDMLSASSVEIRGNLENGAVYGKGNIGAMDQIIVNSEFKSMKPKRTPVFAGPSLGGFPKN